MEIDVNQKKISIGDKYNIFTNGVQTHFASKRMFQWLAEIKLFTGGGDIPVIIIKRRFAFFKAKYTITRADGTVLPFITKSFWKRVYQCTGGNNIYTVYGHRGRKYSIFKNDVQVAWWSKSAVTWFNGDNYKILADNDCDATLLIAFCLIIDNYASNDEKNNNAVNVNVGSIGPQGKKFDANWQPKI
ncbi:MAG TPA: hypothetical protein VHB48_08965 [Chitinophagaceae bacterium]|nr:hypothetical protein [Chitinophagaceae bacterium]